MMLPQILTDAFHDESRGRKALALARLLHALGLVARRTYRPGTDEVSDPVQLRRISELTHRIATKQVQLLTASEAGMPDATFLQFLAEALDEIEVRPDALAELMSAGHAEDSGIRVVERDGRGGRT
ncbi:hypothetical protein ACFJIW_05825 [Tahibacter sp. UC22_41]|uniref:hypothetical protein n=1 Tax=Tahibacter sp. UC22_41 TaxID=3350178 RepID=UPI0036DC78B4